MSSIKNVAASSLAKATSAAANAATPAPAFVPRARFEVSSDITRSYFLGHHQAAVARMSKVLSNIGLIIECRDFRVPISSWNPILEHKLQSLGGHQAIPRIVVYTKRDLGPGRPRDLPIVDALRRFHGAESSSVDTPGGFVAREPAVDGGRERSRRGKADGGEIPSALFLGKGESNASGDRALMSAIRALAKSDASHSSHLLGLRAIVIGMPNAGKSSLLNRLRHRGVKANTKAASTGAQPGITRKLGTPVRILSNEADEDLPDRGVFVMDTPGVFVPYVGDPESMLKLALVNCVRDGLVNPVTLADYLLYHLNLRGQTKAYEWLCATPTNDVNVFLESAARRTGKLLPGGVPAIDAIAEYVISLYRRGELGKLVLDDVNDETLRRARIASLNPPTSLNQARKAEKERRSIASKERYRAGLKGS
ncbi:hypothetical protein MCOR16_008464 [Pyricularia oryzae]|nr:hypothetical protein MCOR15_003192 [Pyricularia oryzae]KAI6519867.1 hypothetical protein MCOR16_008464 [Pyricularia oryzae]